MASLVGLHRAALGALCPGGCIGPLGQSQIHITQITSDGRIVGRKHAGAFERAFGAPVSELETLVSANTVTIARLMELAPPGTVDPSPFLYDSTFYGMAGIISVAAVANSIENTTNSGRSAC